MYKYKYKYIYIYIYIYLHLFTYLYTIGKNSYEKDYANYLSKMGSLKVILGLV